MTLTVMRREIRKMRFEEVYFGWSEIRLTQVEAALIKVCVMTKMLDFNQK